MSDLQLFSAISNIVSNQEISVYISVSKDKALQDNPNGAGIIAGLPSQQS